MIKKNKKILIPLAILSLISLGYIIFMTAFKGKSPTKQAPIPQTGAMYNNLAPGVSNLNDVTQNLGKAVKETQNGNQTILDYKSGNPNFDNQLTLDSGTLTLAKQIVSSKDNITITDLNQKYGNYENMLYKSGSASGFNLYIYPNKGIAYIGHQGSGIVLEIWYFKPMTFEQFKTDFGQGFSDYPVEGQ